jgi:quercetin dioxygenase-like cupin family protein
MLPFRRSILFSILGFFVPNLHSSSRHQDRATVIPDMKVLLENEQVRVQYHDVKVGETTAMHSHPAYVAYVFNAYTGKAILTDGREVPLARQPGDIFYSGPVTHKIVNTGNTPIHNLIVELKKVTN